MSEFEDALQEGFEAHRDATRAKKEIFDTFQELSVAVAQITGQKVLVEAARVEKMTVLQPLAAFVQQTREFVSNQLPDEEMPDALFAVRRGAEHGKRAQLCRLKFGVQGYPVEITIQGRFLHASDRESLKAVLVQLLRHPDVAGKIVQVSQLRGAEAVASSASGRLEESGTSPSKRTAEAAMPWLTADGEAERKKGYALIQHSLQEQEELDPALQEYLRDVALDSSKAYFDRNECVRLLRYADRLDDDARRRLADAWFNESALPTSFSSTLCGVFDQRRHLPILIQVLQRVDVPSSDEALPVGEIASHGYRVSNAFGSIRDALDLNRDAPLDSELRSQLEVICERYKDVRQLGPLLGEIRIFLSSRGS